MWSAYFVIPAVLLYFARRRADLPFRGVFALFGGAPLGTVTYSVGDTGRHYGK